MPLLLSVENGLGTSVENYHGTVLNVRRWFANRRYTTSFGSQVASCDDCGPCGVQTVLTANLGAGWYWLVVDGYSSSEGNFQMSMTCASDLDGAVSCGQSWSGYSGGAGNHVGNSASDHIYEFTLSQSYDVTFNSCGSNYDTWLRVYVAGKQRPSAPLVPSLCFWPVPLLSVEK